MQAIAKTIISITMAAVAANPAVDASTKSNSRQIPIVCPGHTRPLAELQFCSCDDRTFLISACHDRMPMVRDGLTGDWIGTFAGHKGAVWSCRMDPKGVLAATASGDFSVKVTHHMQLLRAGRRAITFLNVAFSTRIYIYVGLGCHYGCRIMGVSTQAHCQVCRL